MNILVVIAALIVGGCGATKSDDAPAAVAEPNRPSSVASTSSTVLEGPSVSSQDASEDSVTAIGDAFGAVMWETRSSGPDPIGFTEDQAKCIGRSFFATLVDQIGEQVLIDSGVTVEAFENGSAQLAGLVSNDDFDLLMLAGYESCTGFVEQFVLEVGDRAGWSEPSVTCFFDTLLSDEATRKIVAWGIFTAGDLGAALGNLAPQTTFDTLFSCMTDIELVNSLAPALDTGPDIETASSYCFIAAALTDSHLREPLQQRLAEQNNLPDLINSLMSETAIAESMNAALELCFTDAVLTSLVDR